MARKVLLSSALNPDLTKPQTLVVLEDGSLEEGHSAGFDSLVGFLDRVDDREISLDFDSFWENPIRAEGRYALLGDADGLISGTLTIIERITVTDDEA